VVVAAYALDALGFVPHTVFWVDFLAREVRLGNGEASFQRGLFGLGAVLGPLLASFFARRLGWHSALSLAFLAKATAVAIPLSSVAAVGRSLSSLVVGALVPAVVALTSGSSMLATGFALLLLSQVVDSRIGNTNLHSR
jgi:hypothetical protein